MSDIVISIDVGGTGMKCALVDRQAQVLHNERHATGRERGPQAVLETILGVAAGLAKTAHDRGWNPIAAGVVVPGIIDEVAGVASYSSNIGFRDVPLRELLRKELNLPVALGHDVRAGGLAEARLGAGRGRGHVLVVPIGTGIAAAHVVHGHVTNGAHGAAGEIGHIVVRPNGPKCGCGQRGCLEAVASASAVERRYAAALTRRERAARRAVDQTSLKTSLNTKVAKRKTAKEIAQSLAKDELAARVWAETVEALADGLLTGQALYDVELVIIGGGLAESGEKLLGPLRERLAGKSTFHRVPEILRAELGDEAGCLGAALLALELL